MGLLARMEQLAPTLVSEIMLSLALARQGGLVAPAPQVWMFSLFLLFSFVSLKALLLCIQTSTNALRELTCVQPGALPLVQTRSDPTHVLANQVGVAMASLAQVPLLSPPFTFTTKSQTANQHGKTTQI